MKKITFVILLLSFTISFAQIARTISFEQPIWPDASAGQTEITPATFTDGLYQFTSTEKIFLNGNAASDGSQSFWPTNFSDGESFTIETTDGSEFDLESAQFLVFSTDSGILSAEGFKDGMSTGIQNTGAGFGTSTAPEETKNVIFDNSIFDSVDRVVLTSTSTGFGWSLNLFDEFVFSEPIFSIDEISSNNNISIFPNPAQSIIKINSNQLDISGVEVYDVLGKLVLKKKLNSIKELDISRLKTGVYLMKMETIEGVTTKKIIKE